MSADNIHRIASLFGAVSTALIATGVLAFLAWVFTGDPSKVSVWMTFGLVTGHIYSDLRR